MAKNLTLRETIAQMIVVRASGYSLDHQRQYPQWELTNAELEELVGDYGVGGIILVGGTAKEIEQRTRHFQDLAKIPLFVCADVEEGVGQRFAGATRFPPPMALFEIWQKEPDRARTLAKQMGAVTAQEALSIGINWLLAPVADVNSNPLNPVINVRSFGTDPQGVKELAGAFVAGAQSYPILTTAKHFPGHGDTQIDSHLATPVIKHDRDHFYQIEFPPFQSLIAGGVDSIMTAHLRASSWDRDNIATCSPAMLTGLLRQEMNFQGLIVTDALVMGGVGSLDPVELAVRAIQAGVDIILMPKDAIATIQGIVKAVENGTIAEDTIHQSWQRIQTAKAKFRPYLPNFDTIGNAQHQHLSQQIARHSLSYHLPNGQPVDIRDCVNLFCGDRVHQSDTHAHHQPATALPLTLDVRLIPYLDGDSLPPVFLQIASRGSAFRGSANWHQEIAQFVAQLVRRNKLRLVILYGSPYNLPHLQELLPPSIPWGFAYSELAQDAIMEKLVAR
jgi:beta-glucosidase